ncbi:MAG: RNA pseudouridine synthase [Bdellovibrionia bacterium]
MKTFETPPLEPTPPEIISETAQWLVLSKPSGWLTIPGRDSSRPGITPAPVLSEWAKQKFPTLFVVHRLDRETSGVVLFARTAEDHQQANLWFQNRKVKKIYHCLAQGQPPTPVLKINLPIAGASSITQVEVKESYPQGFLAQVLPRTGRRHQIRIHLSKNGFPILGDTLYGGPKEISLSAGTLSIPRVALHASSLELPGGETFKAALPPDFAFWLVQLRKESKNV